MLVTHKAPFVKDYQVSRVVPPLAEVLVLYLELHSSLIVLGC